MATLNFILRRPGGATAYTWGLGTGVAVTDAENGLAVLTVTPTMLAAETEPSNMTYHWNLVDGSGNPTLALDTGTLALSLP